jgi:anti-sigma B factor antagonist
MKASVEENRSGVYVVRAADDKARGNERGLVEIITPLLDADGVRIVIDLSQVKFINSSDLGDLVRVTAQANQQKSRVVLAGPSAFVAGVLETTQLHRFFSVFAGVEAAIAALG